MKNKENPFRKGSKFRKVFAVLARTKKAVTAKEIATRARMPSVNSVLAAMRNEYHNAVLRRSPWRVALKEGCYSLVKGRVEKNAKRKPRGSSK